MRIATIHLLLDVDSDAEACDFASETFGNMPHVTDWAHVQPAHDPLNGESTVQYAQEDTYQEGDFLSAVRAVGKVTIVTLYRGRSCETYTAVYYGELTQAEEIQLALDLDLEMEDGEALDTLGFVTTDATPKDARYDLTLLNAFPDERTWSGEDLGRQASDDEVNRSFDAYR